MSIEFEEIFEFLREIEISCDSFNECKEKKENIIVFLNELKSYIDDISISLKERINHPDNVTTQFDILKKIINKKEVLENVIIKEKEQFKFVCQQHREESTYYKDDYLVNFANDRSNNVSPNEYSVHEDPPFDVVNLCSQMDVQGISSETNNNIKNASYSSLTYCIKEASLLHHIDENSIVEREYLLNNEMEKFEDIKEKDKTNSRSDKIINNKENSHMQEKKVKEAGGVEMKKEEHKYYENGQKQISQMLLHKSEKDVNKKSNNIKSLDDNIEIVKDDIIKEWSEQIDDYDNLIHEYSFEYKKMGFQKKNEKRKNNNMSDENIDEELCLLAQEMKENVLTYREIIIEDNRTLEKSANKQALNIDSLTDVNKRTKSMSKNQSISFFISLIIILISALLFMFTFFIILIL
ncbi:conserved Plasmodium protein, unknown function [Plasmodium malariae]|uniref:Uncharacterized protein n=1 Tax=Plasmodium malariae TaxID=5858 RepID=A0A1A8VLE5_PLAMA|nr:conserved Plasmodium protein, unknown function [Plasmodium malariae]SBS81411.1 hypothetical protein PMALA_000580 [Plasmodium malariae]SBT86932.1 conserved Plasmodium protein, unknown function [Plasmodium malariae]